MLTRCKSGNPTEFLTGHAQVEKWRRLAATRSKSRNGRHFAEVLDLIKCRHFVEKWLPFSPCHTATDRYYT